MPRPGTNKFTYNVLFKSHNNSDEMRKLRLTEVR